MNSATFMGTVWITPGYESWFPAQATSSLDGMVACFEMDLETERHRSQTCRRILTNEAGDPLDVYFKGYTSHVRFPAGFGRLSRGILETKNLRNFARWGIPCPEVVAWGFRRRMAGLRSDVSFIVTRTIPETQTLGDYWTGLDFPNSPELRRQLIDQLARQARTLHSHHFFHQDLKWRNVLVDDQDRLFWIDCPNGYFTRLGWRQEYGRTKDLATLDKIARHRCTTEERLRFLHRYLDTDDGSLVQNMADRILRYHEARHS